MPTALITGVNGQDGSYLAEFLLPKGYRVIGTTSHPIAELNRLLHIRDGVEIVEDNLLDQGRVENILRKYKPDEIYNLAARASSSELWKQPVQTGDLNALTVARLLESIRTSSHETRFVQASSREIFGNATETPQTEATPIRPRNPYGVAKAYGHWMTVNYREHQGIFACSCILYNHESPRRSLEFVSRKITHGAARIRLGLDKELRLGTLEARRDWGFAGDYAQAMWLMLQQAKPDDYLIATGETHSVRDFCELAFEHVGLDYRDYVIEGCVDSRQAEITLLVGNAAKARSVLGWKTTVTFPELVRMMVDADLKAVQVLQRR